MTTRSHIPAFLVCALASAIASAGEAVRVERVSTCMPFPRGLAMVGDKLYVLCRGRVRGAGGVSASIDDQAGTLYVVDPDIVQPIAQTEICEAVRRNGSVFARPAVPPFRLWDRASRPPESDRQTDRPYCTLRYHEPTRSFYICCFSGIDLPKKPGEVSFSKNLTDSVLHYDLRTRRWYEIERHRIEAGGSYPHHDTRYFRAPRGRLNGPDNCLAVGEGLYVVAKENSVLVRYDLTALIDDPDAGSPPSELVFDRNIVMEGAGPRQYFGPSALAFHDRHLYVGYRTSSVILRIPLDSKGLPIRPIVGQLVARFEPFDPVTRRSADLTDMAFDSRGWLYVVSARPARVYRLKPDPSWVFDARSRTARPWIDLAALTGNPTMKSENILIDGHDRLYIASGDCYDFQRRAYGTIYRLTPLGE